VGYHRCNGEQPRLTPCGMKSVQESSVRSSHSSPPTTKTQTELGGLIFVLLGAPEMGAPSAPTRVDGWSALPGYSRPPNASWDRLRKPKRGKLPSPAMSTRGGVSVVVRARESRVHGEGRRAMHTRAKTAGKAMYLATSLDKSWLYSVQSACTREAGNASRRHRWKARRITKDARRVWGREARRRADEKQYRVGRPLYKRSEIGLASVVSRAAAPAQERQNQAKETCSLTPGNTM
jgi:hypothetical protein